MAALEYEDLPRMQSLTPEPDDTGSLKDGMGAPELEQQQQQATTQVVVIGGSSSCDLADDFCNDKPNSCDHDEVGYHSPLYNYSKYNLKYCRASTCAVYHQPTVIA